MRNSGSGPLIPVKQGKINSGSTINAHSAGIIAIAFPGILSGEIAKVTAVSGEWNHFIAMPWIDAGTPNTVYVYVWNPTAGNITLAADLVLAVSVEPRG